MNTKSSIFALLLIACSLGCGGGGDYADKAAPAPAEAAPATGTSAATEASVTSEITGPGNVHAVRCGCAIESVGQCGNYIEVAGEFVPLAGEIGLGEMAFCGRSDLAAEVTGTLVDGEFVAQTFTLRE